MKKLTVLTIFIVAVFGLSFAVSANAASEEEKVLEVATNFVKAQNANDSELMQSLWYQNPKTTFYNPNQTFLTRGWMEGAAGEGITFTMSHPEATMVGQDAAVITGYYTVEQFIEGQGPTSAEVKETLVVEKIDGKWLIVHQHSTFIP